MQVSGTDLGQYRKDNCEQHPGQEQQRGHRKTSLARRSVVSSGEALVSRPLEHSKEGYQEREVEKVRDGPVSTAFPNERSFSIPAASVIASAPALAATRRRRAAH